MSVDAQFRVGLASGLILLACSPPYLAKGAPTEERAIAKAVFAYHVAAQRRGEHSTTVLVDIELDTRRLQWEEGSDSLVRSGAPRV